MANIRKAGLLETFDKFPPFLVFALARKSYRLRPPLPELAKTANLNIRTFSRVARKISWSNVKVGVMESFCLACGVDMFRLERQKDFMKKARRMKRPFAHLTDAQLRAFEVQCNRWSAARANRCPSASLEH